MAVNILLKRSATADKRPVGASMAFGELNLNYDASTGGLYYKDSLGAVVKVGPCQVSATAPNSSPAGSAGNSAGEFWYDSSTSTLKVYNGTTWVEAGGSVDSVSGAAPITVDNSDPLNPVIGVDAASTSAPGVVQLNNTTSSTSDTEALTAAQGKSLQDQIDALVISSNLTFAGTLDTATGNLLTVTSAGTTAGFVIGDPLPAADPSNEDYFVIVEVASASYTPPGGSAVETHIGDWFLSDGSAWQFLNVGFQAPYASTTTPGIVQLATDAEVQAGVETTHAVTSSGLQSKVSDSVSTTSSTTIASSTAVKTAYDAGVQGQADAAAAQATADQAVIDAAAAQATAAAAMPKAGGDFTGTVIFTPSSSLLLNAPATVSGVQLTFEGAAGAGAYFEPSSYLQMEGDIYVSAGGALTTYPGAFVNLQSDVTVDGVMTFNTAPTFPAGVDIGAAAQVTYDNATSGLSATNVQAAIDELAGEVDGVQGITGAAPITVDNTDPANPVVGIDAASTTAAGAVQLYNNIDSTSTTEAATANAVKIAYDAAIAAASAGDVSGIASNTVIFVNSTDGNDFTGQRGTTKAFLTITAALAAAQESDTIFLSPGTFTENVAMTKTVNMVGTMHDQSLTAGTRILGNFSVAVTGAGARNWSISNVYFISANSTPPFSVTNNSFGAGGIGTVNGCTFTQQTNTDPTQYAVVTSGTWTRSLYFRECTFDGNFHHNAGTAAGASGYVVIDRLLGVGSSGFYNRITTGTVEFRNPSNTLASIFQTGGVVIVNGAASGITASGAGLNSVFGTSGFSYKGSAAAAGAGTVYFSGECQGTGKVDVGANVIYGWTNLIIDPANLTVSGSAIAYTTAVPAAANAQSLTQQRPRLDLLKTTSSISAANQLGTVIDSSTGAIYSVSALDAGTF
jgi:hypothetical protein